MPSPFLALLTLPLLALLAARAEGPAELGDWIRASGERPEARARMRAWADDDRRVTEVFVGRFPGWVQDRIATALDRRLPQAISGCEPSARVGFVEPGSVGTTEVDRAFELSTFQIETLHCLDHGDAERAMTVYNSRAFRLDVMPGLEHFSREGDRVCLVTGGLVGIVGRTEICLVAREYAAEGVRVFHTRLVHSADAPQAQGVFLRESVVAFVDRAEGGVAVYRNVYTRSKDMGAVQRSVLARLAGGSQDKIAEALEEQLR